ncbi:MAG: adenylate/guanylate cyclase domain-containing protein [Candidatus Nitrohelix vancouverensis]|uniref:Adenylate/guanylate cyclase domain-containing protein n=1 Tax=Candidatus Nitrohelix vancouverensis TaxID=2705534 RepID=A0A7T0C0J1_9BACT|nr:MAG: adenylate/guanylate cyclase domain-containing protein [Candidatus Nitrohelix vancouverensis]
MLSVFVVLLAAWQPAILEVAENHLTDIRFVNRGEIDPGPEVAVVAIDEKSVDALGQWPWPRSVLALLTEKLTQMGVITIGYDVVFAESGSGSRSEALVLLEDSASSIGLPSETVQEILNEIMSQQTSDEHFADLIEKSENVVLGYFFHDDVDVVSHLSKEQIDDNLRAIESTRYISPQIKPNAHLDFLLDFNAVENSLPMFIEKSMGGGFLNIQPDRDGVLRRFPLIVKAKEHYYAPLFLQALAHFLEEPPPNFRAGEFGVESVFINDLKVPTDLHAKFLINFYGDKGQFPYYSVIDILQDKVDPDLLDSRLVLVGATGKGLTDLRPTPFQNLFPGVEIHATIVDNILHSNYLHEPKWYHTLNYALIIFFGVLLSAILPKANWALGFVFSTSLFVGFFFFAQHMFNQGVLINLTYPSLQILLVFISITSYNYFFQSKQSRFIQGAFGQYLSPEVINRLLKDPKLLKLGGIERRMTAYFSDIAGFSSFSEQFTPNDLVEFLNEYLTAMSDVVMQYDGTIDKYEGDAIIAFYGAPIEYPDHALKACLASLAMNEKISVMRDEWRKQGKPDLHVRMGINTGSMVVGNMGSKMRMDYTIMGDSVNLASRLEGVNKVYGTAIMISQYTYGDVKDDLEIRELDMIRVVGKNEPITIYEVLAKKGELDPESMQAMRCFEDGLRLYRGQEFEAAKNRFNDTLNRRPGDGPSKTFIARCDEYLKDPPPESWDGVYQMTSK